MLVNCIKNSIILVKLPQKYKILVSYVLQVLYTSPVKKQAAFK
nr:MAG TPA: hypothetical protein [Caudoviricetes sp.]